MDKGKYEVSYSICDAIASQLKRLGEHENTSTSSYQGGAPQVFPHQQETFEVWFSFNDAVVALSWGAGAEDQAPDCLWL